jgi:hypothetical protein
LATSRSFQVHRNWKIAKAGQRRKAERQDDLGEDLEIRGAVDRRVLDDVARQADHVVAQQIDRERQAEAGMRQPDAQIALPDADGVVQLQKRDQRQLQRHHQQGHDKAAISSARPGNSIQASA